MKKINNIENFKNNFKFCEIKQVKDGRVFGKDITNINQNKNLMPIMDNVTNGMKQVKFSKINQRRNISLDENMLSHMIGRSINKNTTAIDKKIILPVNNPEHVSTQVVYNFNNNFNSNNSLGLRLNKKINPPTREQPLLKDSNVNMEPIGSEDKITPDVININMNMNMLIEYRKPELEYIDDIFTNLKNDEKIFLPISDYIYFQTELNEKMRIILIEWLVDVVVKFQLKQETLFLTVTLVDKFLSLNKIIRSVLQLVGVTCLLISCKYEEIYFPEIRDMVYISDKAFTKDQILQMERDILTSISYEIRPIYPLHFLQIIKEKLNLSDAEFHLCCLMLEISLFDYSMVRYYPSVIACSSVYITLKVKNQGLSNTLCEKIIRPYFDVDENILRECARKICTLLDNINYACFRKIKEKYSRPEYHNVGNFNSIFIV
jgi:hypothetical protein